MPDWLAHSLNEGGSVSLDLLVTRLLLSLLLGSVVAVIYAVTQRKTRPELMSFVTTLVLLTILIAMVTLVIGNSVARAFSLVGALAIVRFRTVVEDTRDTAFVIFAVVVGMAAGAGYLLVPLVGIPTVAVAAFVLSRLGRTSTASNGKFILSIRLITGRDPNELFRDTFAKYLSFVHLHGISTARGGSALDLSYNVRFRAEQDILTLVNELNQIEGVQSVELKP